MANIYVSVEMFASLFAIELKLLCFSPEWMATNNWVDVVSCWRKWH